MKAIGQTGGSSLIYHKGGEVDKLKLVLVRMVEIFIEIYIVKYAFIV